MTARIHIHRAGTTFNVDEVGRIGYITTDGFHVIPSDSWKLTGAVEFGRGCLRGIIIRRWSLADILNKQVPWFWKNGKQCCYPTDLDHGTRRVWANPPIDSVTVLGRFQHGK